MATPIQEALRLQANMGKPGYLPWEPVISDGPSPWIDTSPDIQELGISRYKLVREQDDKKAWEWVLWFTNTKGWGFVFTDATGDTYTCSTPVNGNHSVGYDSKKPTIVRVE